LIILATLYTETKDVDYEHLSGDVDLIGRRGGLEPRRPVNDAQLARENVWVVWKSGERGARQAARFGSRCPGTEQLKPAR